MSTESQPTGERRRRRRAAQAAAGDGSGENRAVESGAAAAAATPSAAAFAPPAGAGQAAPAAGEASDRTELMPALSDETAPVEPVAAESASSASSASSGPATEPPASRTLTRRELRELRASGTSEQVIADLAGQATGAGTESGSKGSASGGGRSAAGATSSAAGAATKPDAPAEPSTPSRRSMRDRPPPAQTAVPGRGERVPPGFPTVRPPASAQGVRSVDETGGLSEVRPTRSQKSPVEVTGPLDWQSSVTTGNAGVDAAKAAESEAPDGEDSPPPLSAAPQRRSVLGGASATRGESSRATLGAPSSVPPSIPPASASTPATPSLSEATESTAADDAEDETLRPPVWEPVRSDAGASVPTPPLAPPPSPRKAFGAAAPATEKAADAEHADDEPRRSWWSTPVGFLLLGVLGVGLGVALFLLLT